MFAKIAAALGLLLLVVFVVLLAPWRDDAGGDDAARLSDDFARGQSREPEAPEDAVRRSHEIGSSTKRSAPIPIELKDKTTFDVELVFDDGAPIGGARVVLATDGLAATTAVTDAIGRLTVPVHFADAWFAVSPASARPIVRKLAVRSEMTRIALARGVAVSGRVVVEDAATDVDVSVLWTDGRIPGVISEIPDDVISAFEEAGFELRAAVSEVATRPEPDGRFEISGLEPGEVGTLVARPPADESPTAFTRRADVSCAVVAPTEGIVLTIKRERSVVGRVVREKDGSAIASAPIMIGFNSAMPIRALSTDDAGRFRIPVRNDIRAIRVIATDPDLGTEKLVRFAGPWQSVIDLGDIVCPSLRPVDVVVKDAADRPVGGAVVAWCDVESSLVATTDADGKARISMCDSRTLGVAKPGFATNFVVVPARATAPIDVTLHEGTRLRVRLKAYSDAMIGELGVSVAASSGVFDTPNGVADNATWSSLHGGGSRPPVEFVLSGAREQESKRWEKATAIGATAEFSFLKPQSVIVRVADGSYAEWRRIDLLADRTNEVEFVIGEPPRRLKGFVRDESGRPIENAEVKLLDDSNRRPVHILTEASGEFASEKPFSRYVDIVVDHPDFSPIQMLSFEVPTDDRPIEIVLPIAKPFFLGVNDADGRPVSGARLQTINRISGRDVAGRPGIYLFARVPVGRTMFLIEVGLEEYAFEADASAGDATFRLPPLGKIEVSWDFELPKDVTVAALLQRVASRASPIEIPIAPEDRRAGGRVLFEQLPAAEFEVEIVERRPGARRSSAVSTTAVTQVAIGETSRATVSHRP